MYPKKMLFLSIAFFLSFGIFAQIKNETTNATVKPKINKLYLDLSIGGMGTGSGDIAFNVQSSIGFQKNAFLGFGVGFAYASNYNDITHRIFNGVGLEYRMNYQQILLKYMVGMVLKHTYPSDSGEQFKYTSNDLFHRFSIGYIPRDRFFNFGVVINATKGTFNKSFCDNYPVEYCEGLGQVKSVIFNPQLYIGFNF